MLNYSEYDLMKSSPVNCVNLRIIGTFTTLLFASCLLFNSILLWVFLKYKNMRSPTNIFITALTILNLVGSIIEFPFIIASKFACRWIFHHTGCVFSAFIMYFIGCLSIYLLVAISFERYYITKNPLENSKNKIQKTYLSILMCVLVALVWSVLPIIGWSYYSLEGAMTSCSVEWKDRSLNVVSYNLTVFLLVYFVPLLAIIMVNFKLIFMIRGLQQILKKKNSMEGRRIIIERNATVAMIFSIVGFIISWTPYAISSMYTAFINSSGVPPLVSTLPSLFAKSSMLWPPVLPKEKSEEIHVIETEG
ncbi:vertebrate ancient opsin-like [Brachionus plicatilis]|uniref:Vertebrate ancient opsin-like n=1 Tax=Brachionus plicatilis TaxID=10195 RepID=A0A3M7T6V8_BRAPC|nr:vertebrate ancient opsin-like [Brachionus plicatilis]